MRAPSCCCGKVREALGVADTLAGPGVYPYHDVARPVHHQMPFMSPMQFQQQPPRWGVLANKYKWPALGLCAAFFVALAFYLLHRRGADISNPEILPSGYCEAAVAPLPVVTDSSDDGIRAWAVELVRQMNSEEKLRLVRGKGWDNDWKLAHGWYVGSILAVPRLGVPSIQMEDATQGFRTMHRHNVGQSTAFPCGLALAATWDRDAMTQWARAIGTEFRAKGANVILGPGVNVHRVATGGRNAEYISGEDPELGSVLAPLYVQGVQGVGVAAVVKHFVLNEQETLRDSLDVHVDEQTLWEHVYPPFEAAVRAGVASVMCSYNYVNGKQACSNAETLGRDLKEVMGFKGFVMSDWGAIKDGQAAAAGTDQDMAGNDNRFTGSALMSLPVDRFDDMAARVLQGMARGSNTWLSGEPQSCRLGCDCAEKLHANVATVEHATLARQLAASSTVLLKNSPRLFGTAVSSQRVLPLQQLEQVAVVGSACAQQQDISAMVDDWTSANYYVVGGSGRVIPSKVASVLDGLHGRGLNLRESTSDSLSEAESAMQGANIVVVCGGTTSAESSDRVGLHLNEDNFIQEVLTSAIAMQVPAIVVTLVPGAIVAPWRELAGAMLSLFLGGQESGHAIGDVLVGAVNPSGKLPVTFPANEADAVPPCQGPVCKYNERLRGGWHVYDGKPVAFPFGHGLSYTAFEYLTNQDWQVQADGSRLLSIRVRNVGAVAGSEVAQLYVGFPVEEDKPVLLLRGFHKTPALEPGEEHEVQFSLTPRQISSWDPRQRNWRQVSGKFVTKVGSSSRDMRLCGGFQDDVAIPPMGPCVKQGWG